MCSGTYLTCSTDSTQWRTVCSDVILSKAGATASQLTSLVHIPPNTTMGFYLHGPAHNETVAYVANRTAVVWLPATNYLTISIGCYSKSSTPFTRVDSTTRQLAGGLVYTVMGSAARQRAHHDFDSGRPLSATGVVPVSCSAERLSFTPLSHGTWLQTEADCLEQLKATGVDGSPSIVQESDMGTTVICELPTNTFHVDVLFKPSTKDAAMCATGVAVASTVPSGSPPDCLRVEWGLCFAVSSAEDILRTQPFIDMEQGSYNDYCNARNETEMPTGGAPSTAGANVLPCGILGRSSVASDFLESALDFPSEAAYLLVRLFVKVQPHRRHRVMLQSVAIKGFDLTPIDLGNAGRPVPFVPLITLKRRYRFRCIEGHSGVAFRHSPNYDDRATPRGPDNHAVVEALGPPEMLNGRLWLHVAHNRWLPCISREDDKGLFEELLPPSGPPRCAAAQLGLFSQRALPRKHEKAKALLVEFAHGVETVANDGSVAMAATVTETISVQHASHRHLQSMSLVLRFAINHTGDSVAQTPVHWQLMIAMFAAAVKLNENNSLRRLAAPQQTLGPLQALMQRASEASCLHSIFQRQQIETAFTSYSSLVNVCGIPLPVTGAFGEVSSAKMTANTLASEDADVSFCTVHGDAIHLTCVDTCINVFCTPHQQQGGAIICSGGKVVAFNYSRGICSILDGSAPPKLVAGCEFCVHPCLVEEIATELRGFVRDAECTWLEPGLVVGALVWHTLPTHGTVLPAAIVAVSTGAGPQLYDIKWETGEKSLARSVPGVELRLKTKGSARSLDDALLALVFADGDELRPAHDKGNANRGPSLLLVNKAWYGPEADAEAINDDAPATGAIVTGAVNALIRHGSDLCIPASSRACFAEALPNKVVCLSQDDATLLQGLRLASATSGGGMMVHAVGTAEDGSAGPGKLITGDRLLAVGNKSVEAMTCDDVSELLHSPPSAGPLTMSLRRAATSPALDANVLVLNCVMNGSEKTFTFHDGEAVRVDATEMVTVPFDELLDQAPHSNLDHELTKTPAPLTPRRDPSFLARLLSLFTSCAFDATIPRLTRSMQTMCAREMLGWWLDAAVPPSYTPMLLRILCLGVAERVDSRTKSLAGAALSRLVKTHDGTLHVVIAKIKACLTSAPANRFGATSTQAWSHDSNVSDKMLEQMPSFDLCKELLNTIVDCPSLSRMKKQCTEVACALAAFAMDARVPPAESTFALRALCGFVERQQIAVPDAKALTAHAVSVIQQRLRAAATRAKPHGTETACALTSISRKQNVPKVGRLDAEQIDHLVNMGFAPDQATFAFLKAKKNLEDAVELLCAGGVPKFPYGNLPETYPLPDMNTGRSTPLASSPSPQGPANAVLEVDGAGEQLVNGYYACLDPTDDERWCTFQQVLGGVGTPHCNVS